MLAVSSNIFLLCRGCYHCSTAAIKSPQVTATTAKNPNQNCTCISVRYSEWSSAWATTSSLDCCSSFRRDSALSVASRDASPAWRIISSTRSARLRRSTSPAIEEDRKDSNCRMAACFVSLNPPPPKAPFFPAVHFLRSLFG